MFSVEEIVKATGGEPLGGQKVGFGGKVSGISIDTRTLKKGEVFFAIRGERFDGHEFLQDAFEKGCSAAVVSHVDAGWLGKGRTIIVVDDVIKALGRVASYNRMRMRARVVAITGSCGKTTTKEIMGKIFSVVGRCAVTRSNENNYIGVPLTLLSIEEDDRFAVVEMGCSRLGEIAYLSSITKPDGGLITCVSPTHTEFLGDVDGVARAKEELFLTLRSGAVAIVNLDDPRIVKMRISTRNRFTFSARRENAPGADLLLESVSKGWDGFSQILEFNFRGIRFSAPLRMVGIHSAYNALSAASAGLAFGICPEAVVEGLTRATPPPGRGVFIQAGGVKIVDDSYNASPSAMKFALESLNQISSGGRKMAFVGDMKELGRLSKKFHREVGAVAARNLDLLFVVGEFSGEVVEGAVKEGMDGRAIKSFRSSKEAASYVRGSHSLKEGDVVLVKGSRAVKMELIVNAIMDVYGEGGEDGESKPGAFATSGEVDTSRRIG